MAHYRPPRSGKRSLAMAVIAPLVLAASVFVALDRPSVVVAPSAAMLPDTAQRSTKASESFHTLSPMPKAAPAPVEPKTVAVRALGPGVFKCQDAKGAVTYSEFPCGEGVLINTKPTSGGFAENWSSTLTGR